MVASYGTWGILVLTNNDLCVYWRKGVRRVRGLPTDAYCDVLPIMCDSIPLIDVLFSRSDNFINCCLKSDNLIICFALLPHTVLIIVVYCLYAYFSLNVSFNLCGFNLLGLLVPMIAPVKCTWCTKKHNKISLGLQVR